MEPNNYKQEYTITALKGNLIAGTLAIPILLIFGMPFFSIWDNPLHEIKDFITGGVLNIVINLSIFILGVCLHEFIHGITWALFAKNGMKSIKFGIMASSLTPYCHCTEILKSSHYKAGAIMPAIITGLIPSILSIII
jgi:hypothetical protein